ncbi:hypothetical protein F8M41_016371 [Gigaspora margarita]|uniref:Uncharacterized protein n=1 Tax=Gigaspora margarita TaxID=4874 RepID=A0A8H3ZVC9_GIGMA|nr:hypothetical protein F8M41_016371 [Gigaspora margarita]
MNAKLLAEKNKYLEAMKSQQGKHDYEQNNDHYIDSCTEESEEEPEELSENETDESENHNKKGDSDSYKKQPDGY